MASALEVLNVSKDIREKGKVIFSLKNINLKVKSGDFFALLGPNGAGKTTLVSIILGLLKPDRGEVKIFRRNPSSKDALIKTNFLLTEQYEPWNLEVRNILDFYAEVYQIKKRKEKIKSLVKLLKLENLLNSPLYKLSSGECTRVMLARALINNPRLLILDEPTHSLDAYTADKLRNFFLKLNRKGTTILFISHNPYEIEKLAKRIALIKKGRIIRIESKKNIKRKFGSVQKFIKRFSK